MKSLNTNEETSLNLGVSEGPIKEASKELGVVFPKELIEVWRISNGLELPGGWNLYPIFDTLNARKTSNHIVYENSKGRWSYMPDDLISIAGNGTGNQLVLQRDDSELKPEVYIWNHETNKIKKWSKTLDYIREKAQGRVDKINAQIRKSVNKKR